MRRHFQIITGLALASIAMRCDSKPAARTCVISAPAPTDWRLTTDGTVLRDGLGRVVFLRGVDAGGRSKFAPYMPFDFGSDFDGALAQYMDRAKSWGIDAMRVPFTWAALEPTQGSDDPAWLAHYDAFIDAAWSRGIWVVVDFHQDVYAENFCGDGFPSWTLTNPPAAHHDCPQWEYEYFSDTDVQAAFDAFWANGSSVQTAYLSAWDVMIARYKDRPGVIGFEPINEPGWGTADETMFAATTLSAFFQVMVPHMNAMAPSALVFVDPPPLDGIDETTALVKPSGTGVVFAPHFYPIAPNPDATLDAMTKWQAVGAAWNTPVFVGEFGASHDLDSTLPFMQSVWSSLDALALSGTEWEYSVSADAWNSEADGLVDATGTEYPVAQAVIRPYARAVAGASITTSFDTRFTLTYSPTANGVTVVSLPARAYAMGYDVALVGGCYDDQSVPGEMLVQPDSAASAVTLTITPKP